MTGHIFNIQDDGTLVEMNEEPFTSEDVFQELLTKYPNLLAGDQIQSDSPRRWLLVRREMGVPAQDSGCDRWALDHLFLDQDAIPTLVEVKRSSDTRIRREVVGQMLDYAANAVVYWSVEQIQAEFDRTCEHENVDPAKRLAEFMPNEWTADDFWQTVKTNLLAGKIRILFVADVIPPELRRIVEFLNERMDPTEVLAVEIKHYVGQGLKTLVPRVLGQTAEAERKKGAGAKRRPPLTREELEEIAISQGVGELYSASVKQLSPLFDNSSTTLSNLAFNGIMGENKSKNTIFCLIPGESESGRGLRFAIYVDRLAEYFGLESEQVINVLPPCDKTADYGDWAGAYRAGFIESEDGLRGLLHLMEGARKPH